MRKSYSHTLLLAFAFFLQTSLHSASKINKAEIKKTLDTLAKSDGYDNGTVAFSLARLNKNGTITSVFSYNGGKSLMPASTLKLITTGIGLKTLGADYQFKTDFSYHGEIIDGILKGSVHIIGHGDPTLDKNAFSAWLVSLKNKGITRIEGSVIGNASEYGSEMLAEGVEWGDIGNYYGAGAGALCYNRNMFQAVFKPGEIDKKAEFLRSIPELPSIKWVNEMQTGAASSGDNGYIFHSPYNTTIHLRGSVPAGKEFSIYGSIPDPAYCCANELHSYLSKNGIQIDHKATTVRELISSPKLATQLNWSRQTKTNLLHQTRSEALSKICTITNFRSDNLYANAIFRRTCFEKTNQTSHSASADFASKTLRAAEISIKNWRLHDGSGLSRRNLITADSMSHFLAHMLADKKLADTFRTSIPILGREGSVSHLGTNTSVAGRARAKVGYISRAQSYAGYIRLNSGEYLSYAYIINNQTDNSNTDSVFLNILKLIK